MRRALGLFAVAVVCSALTGTAFAHAAYESSEPNNGSTVSSPPSRVIADFTERLSSDNSNLSVFDPCGKQVDHQDSLVANDRITISMSADKQGTYVVRFEALSAVDGHLTSGQFSFTSSGGEPCPDNAAEEEDGSSGSEPRDQPRTEDGSVGDESQDGRDSGAGSRERSEARTRNEDAGSQRAISSDEEGTLGNNVDIAAPSNEGVDLNTEEMSIWDGIPMGDFLIALAVAALIGAAGGRIYAGIVGPRR